MDKTIRIKEETREQLKTLGNKGQTYNDVIKQLIETYKEAEK